MRILLILLIAFPCLGQRVLVPPSDTLRNGLIGWWTLNGNAQDWSGLGNNGTANGATFSDGNIGGCAQFSANANYVS